jgi:hypothetical protein
VPDDITVVFLYNPFSGAALKTALMRVIESFDTTFRILQYAMSPFCPFMPLR